MISKKTSTLPETVSGFFHTPKMELPVKNFITDLNCQIFSQNPPYYMCEGFRIRI